MEINGQNNWLIFQAIIGYNGFLRSDASGPGDSISEKYPEKTPENQIKIKKPDISKKVRHGTCLLYQYEPQQLFCGERKGSR
ncbi:hypothetical protein [Hungatella hathewayi]|uniref:hypothetical protein n=1 Tax=Hungatella hathewayi TaxID=154046 RepID=UPI001A98BACD|nr:hypothetical protein [Hungatella hathewayi]